uniref:AI-2E family transporter n=1 Tax=Marinobacterium profundum TaxID=1714300 RepID=UPI0009E7A81A|nr:AI-2E family transporter [Marinobacterium profundum]
MTASDKQLPLPATTGDNSHGDNGNADSAMPVSAPVETGWSRIETRLLIVLTLLAVVYTLALAQLLLVPIALAFLLSLVLAPVMRWLVRIRIPRPLSAAVIVLLLLSGLNYGISQSIDPLSAWFERAPRLLKQLERKINPIKKTVEDMSKAADQVDRIASVNPVQTVEVKGISLSEMMYSNARGLATGAVTTTLLLYFILSWGPLMLKRISHLQKREGRRDHFIELSVILEAEISKYLSCITLVNFGLGSFVAAALYLFGMPNPLLWGAVAGLLNFIPYLGGLVTALLLGATALLTFDGLALPSMVVATFALLTIIEGQIVTPLVLGHRLSLNPLMVFLSVLFWFWLWGVAGALMAVPMLITLKLVGDRVDALRPIAVITQR